MTHRDYEHLHQTRYRWQKEQQLIRKKYQIPYNMTYKSTYCSNKSIFIESQIKSLFNYEKTIVTNDNVKTKNTPLDKSHFPVRNNGSNNLPIYCSKCHFYLTECTCTDGLGQWWKNLQKTSDSTDKISKQSSINSLHERHVHFDSKSITFSFNDRKNSQISKLNANKQHYVLLDWNNRQSLLNFLRTTQFNKNLSTMTIEQLHKLITNNENIHIFNSIIDLILSVHKEQSQTIFCHIYIDPSYYSTIQGCIPFSQSQLIADNINLTRTLHNIQKLASLLGIKMNQSMEEFVQEKSSTKQRKLILDQQTLFIASKLPYHTFPLTSNHTQ